MNDSVITSICWTLLHSLWQALILVALAGLILLKAKRSSSAVRYITLTFIGLMFIMVVSYTFYQQLNLNTPATDHQVTHLTMRENSGPVLVSSNHNLQQQRQTVMDTVAGFFTDNALFIVLLWFIVFIVKSLQLIIGFKHLYYLKKYNNRSVPNEWMDRLKQLQTKLNIRANILFLESALVNVPVVIGFFKPVIFVPVGLLANIPVHEAEAILLHELAHIRRKDYLVNIIQSFVEVVFFFNPFVLWLSTLIRTERENCCDDIAIEITQNKVAFVQALVTFQEYQLNKSSLALGFSDHKTPLLKRTKRILNTNHKSLNIMEKTFISISLVVAATITFAFSTIDPIEPKHAIDTIEAADPVEAVGAAMPIDPVDAIEAIPDSSRKNIGEKRSELEKKMDLEMKKVDMAMKKHDLEMKKHDDDMKKHDDDMRKHDGDMKRSEEDMRKAELEMVKIEKEMEMTEKELIEAEKQLQLTEREMMKIDAAREEAMLEDFKNEAKIKTIKSFKLDYKELIINGQKQSDDIHQRMLKKYISRDDMGIYYNFEVK